MSSGLKPSPGTPPMVPRMPDIDLISVTAICFAQIYGFGPCIGALEKCELSRFSPPI
jgi:hypothetical protein